MDFPATLPSPLREGYAGGPLDRVERLQFEAGNQRPRRKSASAPYVVEVRWRFTLAQFGIFEDWHANSIHHGADDFNISLPNGLGMTAVVASFDEMYRPTAREGLRWDVTAKLRVTGFTVMAADYLEAASTYAPDEIVYGAAALHTLIHSTLPASYW